MRTLVQRSGVALSLLALVACSVSADHGAAPPAPTTSSGALTNAPPGDARLVVLAALEHIARTEGIDDDVVRSARIENVQRYGAGAIVAQLGQEIEGVEVFGGGLSLVLDATGHPIRVTGALVRTLHPVREGKFAIDAARAVAAAATTSTGLRVEARDVRANRPSDQSPYTSFAIALDPSSGRRVRSARSKRVWFVGKRLQAAYYVELDVGALSSSSSTIEALVVSATDGGILFRHDLTAADSFSYRVWAQTGGTNVPLAGPQGDALFPHPTGTPDSTALAVPIPTSLVTLESAAFSKKDPWLPADATATTGNNVDAYADLFEPDGFDGDLGDLRPTTTGAFAFDRTYDVTRNPDATPDNSMATATQLFYVGNWLHDWFYDAGFDEASKNPQEANFGRGGLGTDPVHFEAQDFDGRNNADAATPADGGSPRIQMYLFNGAGKASLAITAPSSIAGPGATGTATFGPSNFDVTAPVVLVDDGSATTSDACETPFVNAAAVKGKIALVDRGICPFTQKAQNAEAAGAAGVLVVNNVAGGAPVLYGTVGVGVKVPVLSTTLDVGNAIKAELATGVTIQLARETALDRDGGLDTSISAHEWGHVLSNRLIGNANGLINPQGIGMGEGWADFVALLTLVRGSNVSAQEAAGWNGVYPVGGWVNGTSGAAGYYGIRRYPYSADLTKNPLTLKHIQNGTKLPSIPAPSFGEEGSSNAEAHSTGEVWSSMLWQCYVGLLRDKPRLDFEEASKRMRTYLVAGLKLTPRSPTVLEARDALLSAMYAADDADFRICAKAFAERGAGSGAVGPDRTSRTQVGVTESFVSGNDFVILSTTLALDGDGCDGDANFDNGERATVTLTIRNDGIDRLTSTTAKLTSKSGLFAFDGGGAVTFPPSKPFETVEVSIGVTVKGAAPIARETIDIAIDDPTLVVPRTVTAQLPVVVEFDDRVESSKLDTLDNPTTPWTPSADKSLATKSPWKRIKIDGGQRFQIVGDEQISDYRLTSPPLVVSADRSLVMTWSHRFAFERTRSLNYDGGVIEISTDGGVTWVDVGSKAAGLYNGKLETKDSDNPLKGRNAFVYRSAKYPEMEAARLDLGTEYAGQTVQLRFRAGNDEGTASTGWDVDDLAFEGIDNTPFPSRVPDGTVCDEPPPGPPEPTSDAGTDNPATPDDGTAGGAGCGCREARADARSPFTTGGTMFAALGAALLVARRRRRL